VPAVVATTADQSVVYSVSYKGGDEVAAEAFTFAAVVVVVDAETAVSAYEAATIATYNDVATATTLKTDADAAVAAVTDVDVNAAFVARVTTKETANTAILAANVKAVNDATNQPALLTSLAFFNGVDSSLILSYDAKLGGVAINTSVAGIQAGIYEVNFLDQFAKAIGTPSDHVNQLALNSALQYGSDKGVLVNVKLDQYLDSYVTVAEAYTVTTDYITVAQIQTGMINGSTIAVVNAADVSVAAAIAAPATGTKIEAAQALVDVVPADVVITAGMVINTGLALGDNAKTEYNAILVDLRAVKPVMVAAAAGNQIGLLSALKMNFANVNDANIVAYAASLDGTEKTIIAIQGEIDVVNATTSVAALFTDGTKVALATGVGQDEIAASQLLVDVLAPGAGQSALQDDMDVAQAFQDSIDQTEVATTSVAALFADDTKAALATGVGQDAIDASQVLVTALTAGAEKDALQGDIDSAQVLQDASNVELATTSVAALFADETKAALATGVGQDAIDASQVLVTALTAGAEKDALQGDIDAAQVLQDGVDEDARLEAVNTAPTAVAMKTALTNVSISKAFTTFINYSSLQKLEIAELVLANRPALGFAVTSDVTTAISDQNTARTAEINAVNTAKTTGTNSAMDTALEGVNYDAYDNLTAAIQLDVADAFLTAFPMTSAPAPIPYTSITAIRTAIDAAIAQ